jgi:hypothetical protein
MEKPDEVFVGPGRFGAKMRGETLGKTLEKRGANGRIEGGKIAGKCRVLPPFTVRTPLWFDSSTAFQRGQRIGKLGKPLPSTL